MKTALFICTCLMATFFAVRGRRTRSYPKLGVGVRAARRSTLLGVALLVALSATLAFASPARATQFLSWNDELDPSVPTFGASGSITIRFGHIQYLGFPQCLEHPDYINDFLYPAADVYIVPSGSITPGSDLEDVADAPNTIVAASSGAFMDETIGRTMPLGKIEAGTYAVVYDECQDGKLSSSDFVLDPAFRVEPGAADVPFLDQLAVEAEKKVWELIAKRLEDLHDKTEKKFRAAAMGDVLNPAHRAIYGLGKWGPIGSPQAVALLQLEHKKKQAEGIAADPPDPNFETVSAASSRTVIEPSGGRASDEALARVGTLASSSGALAEALLRSLERYQGAQADGNGRWALVHARAIRTYALTLAQLERQTTDALARLRDADAGESTTLDALTIEMQTFHRRVGESGLSAEELREARNLGLSEGETNELEGAIAATNVAFFSRDILLNSTAEARSASSQLAADLERFAASLGPIVSELEANPSVPDDHPVADAGGPYAGTGGQPTSFDGSGSPNAGGTLTYAWDLDGDGSFDDAAGPTPSFTYGDGFVGLVGLEVTTHGGLSNVDYAVVNVTAANRRPSIASASPTTAYQDVEIGSTKTFSVAGADPDGDTVAFEWDVDGRHAGGGSSFSFAPTAADLGARVVRVVASDGRGRVEKSWNVGVVMQDADGDLWRANVDCDESDRAVNPGAAELLGNGKDDDCDSSTADVLVFNSTYEAASGRLPDERCPYWRVVDTASSNPMVADGRLRFATSADDEAQYAVQRASQLRFPARFVLEARLRYVSGTQQVDWRTGVHIAVTPTPGVGAILFVGQDEIFLMSSSGGRGPSATVDTNAQLHTYRIDVAPSGSLRVFQDDVLVLQDSTFANTEAHGAIERVVWGDTTRLASATSEWEFVRHNANGFACREPEKVEFDSVYEAASGRYPNQMCPAWTLGDRSTMDPQLVDGKLVIGTAADYREQLYYIQTPPTLDLPDPLVVEARVKVRASNDEVPWRTPVDIGIARTPGGVGSALMLGQDRVFLLTGNSHRDEIGPITYLDTDDTFHTYRLELGSDGVLELFYDDVFLFSSRVFYNEATNGLVERVYFGDGTLHAHGSSEWEFVRHNGGTSGDCGNRSPVAANDARATMEDTSISLAAGELLANDADADGGTLALTAVRATDETHGSVALANGTVTFAPRPHFFGPTTFEYVVDDGQGGSDKGTVRIDVAAVADMPAIEVAPAGPLPEGSTVRLGARATDSDGDSLTYSWQADGGELTPDGRYATLRHVDGPASVLVRATGSDGVFTAAAEQEVAIENVAPTVTTPADRTVDVGATLALAGVTFEDSGLADTHAASVDWGDASTTPATVSEANGAGTLAASHVYGAPGTYTAHVVVTDDDGATGTAGFDITVVQTNSAPVATDSVARTSEDVSLPVDLAASDANGDSLTYRLVSQPAHGELTGTAPKLTYRPAANFHGSDSFAFVANDGVLDSNTATVTITVVPVNDAPTCADMTLTTDEDTAGSTSRDCSDVDGDSLRYETVDQPAHGTASVTLDGKLRFEPATNFNGTDSFSYRANDGTANSNTANVAVTVNAVNDAPVANDDAYSTDEDTTLTVETPGVPGNDTDVEGDELTAVLVSDVEHGSLTLNADGSFSYEPNANFNGADSFTYKANDATESGNVATVAITVNAVNDAPVAANDAYATDEDTTLSVPTPGLLGNDSDVDGDSLEAEPVSGVSHGSLMANADGSFTYTPAANYNGSDSFTYKATDGEADTKVATVTITVNPVNDAPTVDAGDEVSGAESSAIALNGTVGDAQNDHVTAAWTYTAGAGADAGATCSFADAAAVDTTIICTDDGSYTATLTATDEHGAGSSDSTTVMVANANPAVEISSPDEETGPVAANTAVNVSSTSSDAGVNDTHSPPAGSCAISWGDGSTTPGAFTEAPQSGSGSCSGSHAYTAAGVYTITVTVTDDDGGSGSDTALIVAYDPNAGFVTGGGWIMVQAGSYTADASAAGKGTFGFVSKYKNGATTPEGQTEFNFQVAGFKFHSEAYKWLVVSGHKAQYTGTGRVNGETGYDFRLTAYDGQVSGGGIDRFRLKITKGGVTVFDNRITAPDHIDTADPQAIGGGQIVIHKG